MAGPSTWGYQALGFGAGKKPSATFTHKYTVRLAVFDEDDSCACTLGATQTWYDDYGDLDGCGVGTHCYSVGQWVMSSSSLCGQITAINATAGQDDTFDMGGTYSDCAECNEQSYQCDDSGGDPGGPGGPGGP